MMSYGYKLDEVLNLGFFEAHALWSIQEEIKARDLQELSAIFDNTISNDERRKEVWDRLSQKQPRRNMRSFIPQEVLDSFAEAFKRG